MSSAVKPHLSFWQILNMNVGFFGIQFSFGLQQSNMSPIYAYLGADEGQLPLLWLAGPVTGLLVQPIVGAMSDRTVSRWGRRTPYFLIGAILCSLGLLLMPFSANAVVRCRPAVDPRRGQQRDDGALPRLRERPARAPPAFARVPHPERVHRAGADPGVPGAVDPGVPGHEQGRGQRQPHSAHHGGGLPGRVHCCRSPRCTGR
jgi:hypothetical protein